MRSAQRRRLREPGVYLSGVSRGPGCCNSRSSGGLETADWVATFATNALLRLHRDISGQWQDDAGRPVRLTVLSGGGFLANWVAPANQVRSLFLAGEWQGDLGGSVATASEQLISVPLTDSPRTLDSVLPASLAGLTAGTSSDQSDQINVLDEATGAYRPAWLNAGVRQWIWQDSGQTAGTLVLAPGTSYLLVHQGSGFYWRWR